MPLPYSKYKKDYPVPDRALSCWALPSPQSIVVQARIGRHQGLSHLRQGVALPKCL